MIGRKFGKWSVIGGLKKKGYTPFYKCKCECGTERFVNYYDLRSGKSTNCGCVRKETCRRLQFKHGFSNTRLERIYVGIKSRCYNPNQESYKRYGARGIRMCDEWFNDPKTFYMWATENGYDDKLSIERIDVDGDYEPGNCRWATRHEQARNKSNNIIVTINGETKCLKDWSKEIDVPYSTLTKKIREKGADPKRLVSSYL